MITDLLTPNQWLVISIVSSLLFWLLWEVVLAMAVPWGERDSQNDPPPVIGGLLCGLMTIFVLWIVLGVVQGLMWLWVTP